jgi:hypothetical protein
LAELKRIRMALEKGTAQLRSENDVAPS